MNSNNNQEQCNECTEDKPCIGHCCHDWEPGEECLICGANWFEHNADNYSEDDR